MPVLSDGNFLPIRHSLRASQYLAPNIDKSCTTLTYVLMNLTTSLSPDHKVMSQQKDNFFKSHNVNWGVGHQIIQKCSGRKSIAII